MLLIHADKSREYMRPPGPLDRDDEPMTPADWYAVSSPLAFGAVVGAVVVTDCIFVDSTPPPRGTKHWHQLRGLLDDWDWLTGPWAFKLDGAVRFRKPFAHAGNVGIRPLPGAHFLIHRRDLDAVRRMMARFS